jgi:hypothetical protein
VLEEQICPSPPFTGGSALTNARTAGVNQATEDKAAIASAQVLLAENKALTETVRQRMIMQDTASRVAARTAQTEVSQARLALAQQKLQMTAQRELNAAREASTLGLSGMRFGLMNISMSAALAGAALTGVATAGLASVSSGRSLSLKSFVRRACSIRVARKRQ